MRENPAVGPCRAAGQLLLDRNCDGRSARQLQTPQV